MSKCIRCGADIIPLEMGLTKKLINRGTVDYMCINCLAEKFTCTPNDLREMAKKFKKQGCMLF